MALKFTHIGGMGTGGGSGGTYDHNMLVNRGMHDQHTIESITGLRDALSKKYEKPFSGIPRTDLGFDVATSYDIQLLKTTDIADIANDVLNITSEIQAARGDMATLRQYIDTKVSYADWSGGGGGSTGGGSHVDSQVGYPLYEQYRATEGQTVFLLSKTYEMGSHHLQVYLDGLLMIEGEDYKEVDDHTVEFLFPLDQNSLVLFMVRAVIQSGLHEEYVASDGQLTFKLVNPYGIYQNILQVFRNGILQRKGRDYKEIDKHTVEFYYPMDQDDFITFFQAGATDPIAGTIMESEIGRMKMNQAYMTMKIHDAIQTEDTDYIDMYVDTFITDAHINQYQSLTYRYENQGISLDTVHMLMNTTEAFAKGSVNGTDTKTYQNQIQLANLQGGSELNSFGLPTIEVSRESSDTSDIEPVIDIHTIRNSYGRSYTFSVIERASGITQLYVQQSPSKFETSMTDKIEELHMTDGYILGLRSDVDERGYVHLVFQEHGTVDGISKVYYIVLDKDSTILSKKVVSDPNFDAISPDISVERDGTAHLVFSSKRVILDRLNVDYRSFTLDTESGFRSVTIHSNFDTLNPSIAVGQDRIVRIVYENIEINQTTKNIKYAEFENGTKMYETFITNSTTFDNVMPDIEVDSTHTSRIVWRSKRTSANYGIDYCAISPDHTISSVKSVASASTTRIFGRPHVGIDYEDISHIVFHGNTVQALEDNICYAAVHPDNQVVPFIDIASNIAFSYIDPHLSVYGEELVITYTGNQNGYKSIKSLANFAPSGRYDIILDSFSDGTGWTEILLIDDQPTSTSIRYEYRLTDDQVIWTSWSPISDLPASEETGRYLQIRAILETTDMKKTPTILSIEAICNPDTIEIQSKPKSSTKDVTSVIVVAKYEGDIKFEVSRDGGTTFIEAPVDTAVKMAAVSSGRSLVIKAKIKNGSRLDAWGMVW